jgi:tRNA pseudouridine38-40 synthase
VPAYRFTLRYDGTDFSGSQVQPGQRSVQGELEHVLSKLGEGDVRAVFAGRTDRGVHAHGQVAAAHLPQWNAAADALAYSLNALLPEDLRVSSAAECEVGFNPRFAALWREYRYWIVPGVQSPFVSRYAWTPRFSLDVVATATAAKLLEGKRDFATFAGGGEGVPWSERASRPRGTVRTVLRCECEIVPIHDGPLSGDLASGVRVQVVADGFLPQMVRNVVGALVEVGKGKREPGWIGELLEARDRRRGPTGSPAKGLTLWRVGFA